MGARQVVVMGAVLAVSAATAHAQRATLEPTKLSLFVPSGWSVVRDRARDVLHYEAADDGGRSFDLSFDRVTVKCKAWKPYLDSKKASPAYWPKAARTTLFSSNGPDGVTFVGCLADVTGGALVARLLVTTEAGYKLSKDDNATLAEAFAAALEASEDLPPLTTTSATTTPATVTPATVTPTTTTVATEVGDPATLVKGGAFARIPGLDLAIRMPKSTSWFVGMRGESTIKRLDGVNPAITATLTPLVKRTCNEWRVDMSTTSLAYDAKAAYLPSSVKAGAFQWVSNGTQISTCVATKAGTLGVTLAYAGTLAGDDVTVVRQLFEAVAVAAGKRTEPFVAAPTLLDGDTWAEASVGKVRVPSGAQWRVVDGTIERLDKGAYFSLASETRASSCAASDAKDQPFLPAGVKGTVEKKGWGTTVVKACITGRNVQLTLAYDGAIATSDHALIKALVEAFAAKKPATKT